MGELPKEWQVYQRRYRPQKRPSRPKARLQSRSRRYERSTTVYRIYSRFKVLVVIAIATVALLTGIALISPWPLPTTLKHIAAAPNCNAARAVGLAPAYKAQPGYWRRHDRDRDGRACEPWLRR